MTHSFPVPNKAHPAMESTIPSQHPRAWPFSSSALWLHFVQWALDWESEKQNTSCSSTHTFSIAAGWAAVLFVVLTEPSAFLLAPLWTPYWNPLGLPYRRCDVKTTLCHSLAYKLQAFPVMPQYRLMLLGKPCVNWFLHIFFKLISCHFSFCLLGRHICRSTGTVVSSCFSHLPMFLLLIWTCSWQVGSFSSFKSLLKCHFLWEAFPKQSTWSSPSSQCTLLLFLNIT